MGEACAHITAHAREETAPRPTFQKMGDQYYVDEYDEELDMDELKDYMSPDEGDGDLAGFERPEMNVDFSTAVVVSNLPQVLYIVSAVCVFWNHHTCST